MITTMMCESDNNTLDSLSDRDGGNNDTLDLLSLTTDIAVGACLISRVRRPLAKSAAAAVRLAQCRSSATGCARLRCVQMGMGSQQWGGDGARKKEGSGEL